MNLQFQSAVCFKVISSKFIKQNKTTTMTTTKTQVGSAFLLFSIWEKRKKRTFNLLKYLVIWLNLQVFIFLRGKQNKAKSLGEHDGD